jgi:putative ABC transport system permease protein
MNYIFKSIIRNFSRKPVTNLINLIGLATSLTLVIILAVYCYSELTTDNFQVNGSRVYIYGLTEDRIYTPGILKEQIETKIPGVESSLRIGGSWEAPVFQVDDKEPLTSDLIFADDNFFKLFTYQAIEGNLQNALKEPMTVVISKSLSDKLFGSEKAFGKQIKLNNSQQLTVTAVIKEPKANTCLSFNAITSMGTRKIVQNEEGEFTAWNQCNFQTFVLLREGSDPDATSKTILSLFPDKSKVRYKDQELVPLKKIYFSKFTLFGSNYLLTGDKTKVMILVLVALMVLIVAFINFINISAAQWQEKIRQTGVMKVIGAGPGAILRGIITESFLFFLAALLIAIYMVNTFKSTIYDYTGIHYDQNLTFSAGFIITSLILTFIISTILSIIPASRISSSRAVDNLKKTVKTNRVNFSFSGLLVTIQFTIAIGLIAFTLLVQKQIRFGSSSLGMNQENIIGIKLTEQLNQKKEVIKKLLQDNPNVKQVSFSQYYPGKTISEWGTNLILDGEKKEISFNTFSSDARLFDILGLELIMGRFYSDDLISDKGKIIVNETFLKNYDIANPIGGVLEMNRNGYNFEIAGVVKDFNYQPVNRAVAPLAIRNEAYASYCIASLMSEDFKSLNSTVENIKKSLSELSPSFPVEVSFFDKAVQNMYKSELSFRRTFSLLAVCAIVICSMGILAMSIFSCQKRIKEIGIRKVNGARIVEILTLLNREFGKWVMISFIVSIPVAWFAARRWLEIFTYRTEVSWWIFALAGLFAFTIALLTVSWQSWRAATRNPVEALRYE